MLKEKEYSYRCNDNRIKATRKIEAKKRKRRLKEKMASNRKKRLRRKRRRV